MKFLNKFSISKKISIIVAVVLVVFLSLNLIVSLITNEKRMIENAESEINNISMLVKESIIILVSMGSDDVGPILRKMRNFKNVFDVSLSENDLIGPVTL